MIPGVFHVPVHTVLDAQHSLNIEISCSGNQISLVSIDTAERECNQMAPVVEIQTVNKIIFHCVPPGGSDHTD